MSKLSAEQLKERNKETLFINRSDSRCGNCGHSTYWRTKTHEINLGWNMDINGTPGCGVEWKYLSSDYVGMQKQLMGLREDLEWVGIDDDEWARKLEQGYR